MKPEILPLMDNALFLQSFRERMRPVQVLACIIIVLIVIALIFTNAFVNETSYYVYDYNSANPYYASHSKRQTVPWLEKVFWDVAVGQGLLLLFMGTLSAFRKASRERVSGTLDFHRASPTSRLNQIIGLILGGPILEWCLFAGTLFISFALVCFTKIPLMLFVKFYGGLILCAVFYHTIGVLFGVWSPKTGVLAAGRFGILKLFVLLYLFMMIFGFFAQLSLSSFYFLTWMPMYDSVSDFIFPGQYKSSRNFYSHDSLYTFFAYPINPTWFQLFVLAPLIGFFSIGVGRKISHPEKPILSKAQLTLFIFFILFLFLGSSYSALTIYTAKYLYGYMNPLASVARYFVYLSLFFGMLGALEATPNRFQYLKGLRRAKKIGNANLGFNADEGSNVLWLASISLITVAIFGLLARVFPAPLNLQALSVLTLLAYIWFFGSFLEYYRLSKYGSKQIMFWVIIGVLWFFVPMFGLIVDQILQTKAYVQYFFAFSPIFGSEPLIKGLLGPHIPYAAGRYYSGNFHLVQFKILVDLVPNVLGACILSVLAYRERKVLQQTI